MDKFQEEIINFLKKETKLEEINLEVPPKPEMGDYAFPCFNLAKIFKKNPNEIAKDLAKKLHITPLIREAKATGPYLNFFTNNDHVIIIEGFS